MSSDSLKLCYASVALNPRHSVGWIAQMKTVMELCLTRLLKLRPETAVDTPVSGRTCDTAAGPGCSSSALPAANGAVAITYLYAPFQSRCRFARLASGKESKYQTPMWSNNVRASLRG